MKKLDITLSYGIDGPDPDFGGDSDCSDDGNAEDDKAKASFRITVVEVGDEAVEDFGPRKQLAPRRCQVVVVETASLICCLMHMTGNLCHWR